MSQAFDYAKARADADRLIAKFGMPGAIRRTESGGGNAYDPDAGTTVTIDHPCTLVLTGYSLRERESTLIEANDRKVLVAASGLAVEPQEEDVLVVGSEAFAIVNVEKIAPGGVTILWKIQARS